MPDVDIRDFVLRLPGVTREQASAIAAAVARRVANGATDWRGTDTALAMLRVEVQRGASSDDIVRRVADAITGMLR